MRNLKAVQFTKTVRFNGWLGNGSPAVTARPHAILQRKALFNIQDCPEAPERTMIRQRN